jgi:hypothetical protein
MVDNFEEGSLLLDSITEVKLTSNDTLFLKKEGTYEVKYALRYFSKMGEVSLWNSVKPKLYLNGNEVENTEIDLSQESNYTLQAEFPNKSKIQSNALNIRVLSIINAITAINLELKGVSNVLIPELEDPSFDDLFKIELSLLTGEKLVVNQSFFDFKYVMNGESSDSFQVRDFETGKDAAIQISINNIISNAIDFEVLTIKDAVEEIELKLLDNISQINKAETQGLLTDFIAINARLKNSELIDLKSYPGIYTLEYNEVNLSDFNIKQLPDGKFKLRAAVGQVFSNSVDLEVFDPMTYIKSIDLIMDERTRNVYAVAGSSELDFTYEVIGMDNAVLTIPATLIVDGQKQDSFKNIPINKAGIVNVYAEISGKKSNTIQIISRQNQVLQKIRVPIIFHVLDNLENEINRAIVDIELEKLNKAFANEFQPQSPIPRSSNSVNSFIEFFLVEMDEFGNLLQEKGINRIPSEGMTFNNTPSKEMGFLFKNIWDPRKYVNVFVGRMDRPAGYAYLPIIKDRDLDGIDRIDDWYELSFPYSTVIADFVMGLPSNTTLAHEIGHMLGLYHPFGDMFPSNQCIDGDFCPDTETHLVVPTGLSTVNILKNCENQTFYSANIMDYLVNDNSFTYDQRERMRTIAVYNPFFAKESNYLNARLKPFEKGKLDPSIKPVACANQNHFGRRFHSH